MASSSENLDSWTSRPVAFPDAWFSEAYARDTETLTKALQMSLSRTTVAADDVDSFSPFLDLIASNHREVAVAGPPATSAGSSEPETPPARRNHRAAGGPTGKVSKRKSRAAKRSQTTFITADPANFRQMVQQVTGGVRFPAGSGHQVVAGPLVRPEPQRLGSGLVPVGCLPTLDTSAFLLDRYQRDTGGGPAGPVDVSHEPVSVGPDGPGCGFDFEAFSCYPTLDSWKVVT